MPPRVVSLLASGTEIICALGMENALVGRSHECDYPPSIKRLPVCTEPAFAIEGSSAEIDKAVREALRDALSVYRVHDDLLERLKPDVVITQAQCEVCAVSLKDVEAAAAKRTGLNTRIVSLKPDSFNDLLADIGRVADALGVRDRGLALVRSVRQRMLLIEEKARALKAPTVAVLEWIEPLMAAGNWTPTLVSMAGGKELFGQEGRHSDWLDWDDLKRADPDIIVIAPCGFGLGKTRMEMPSLVNRMDWQGLKAVKKGRVYLADGNQFFNRPGPRVAETLEILAEILHPEEFHFGWEGKGWRKL